MMAGTRNESASQLLFDALNKWPAASTKDNFRLGRLVQAGDKAAAVEMWEKNLAFSISLASKFPPNHGVSREDLHQAASVGLWEAVVRYDPSFKVPFTSYAKYWVNEYIGREIAYMGHPAKIPVNVWRESRKRLALERRGLEATGKTTHTKECLDLASLAMTYPVELDEDVQDWKDTLKDRLVAPPQPDTAGRVSSEAAVDILLAGLDERERYIVVRMFGLGGSDPVRQNQIGEEIGRSGERVRQIKNDAFKRLKKDPQYKHIAELLED